MIVRIERAGHDILLGHNVLGGVSISRDWGTTWKPINDPLEYALKGEVDILEAYETLCNTPLENELLGYQVTEIKQEGDPSSDTSGDWDRLRGNSWLKMI